MSPITITIPAAGAQSGIATFSGRGKYFLLTAINGTIRVLTSNHDEFSFAETGSGFGNDTTPEFGKLTFYNDSGSVITITFYVSNSPIKTPDVTVQSSVTVNTQLTNTLAGCAAANLADLAINAAAINTAYPFAGGSTPFRKIIVLAFKAFATPGNGPTANTGTVYIGVSANRQPIALAPGDVWTLSAETGAKFDLISFYLSAATAGDGVLVIYS